MGVSPLTWEQYRVAPLVTAQKWCVGAHTFRNAEPADEIKEDDVFFFYCQSGIAGAVSLAVCAGPDETFSSEMSTLPDCCYLPPGCRNPQPDLFFNRLEQTAAPSVRAALSR